MTRDNADTWRALVAVNNNTDNKILVLPTVRSISPIKPGKIIVVDQLPIDLILFFDTDWEFAGLRSSIQKLRDYVRQKRGEDTYFVTLKSKKGFNNLIKKYRWPDSGRRWCTAEKRETIRRFYRKYLFTQGVDEIIEVIGYAADEPERIAKKEIEKQNKKIWPWFPMRYEEWATIEDEALEFCKSKGFDWDGLYDRFTRVSCFCCPLQPHHELKIIRQDYPELRSRILKMEKSIPDDGIHYITFQGPYTAQKLDQMWAMKDTSKLFDYNLIKKIKKTKNVHPRFNKVMAPAAQLSLFHSG